MTSLIREVIFNLTVSHLHEQAFHVPGDVLRQEGEAHTVFQHVGTVRDRHRLFRVLLDKQNGLARLTEGFDDLKHLADEKRRQAHRRLVKH